MKEQVKLTNAIIISLWLCTLGIVIAIAVSMFSFWVSVIFAIVWVLVFGVCTIYYICTFKIHFTGEYISIRHGVFFKFVHKIPIRFVTSCEIFTAPFQRRTNSCVFVLIYSGGVLFVPGLSITFANTLMNKIIK